MKIKPNSYWRLENNWHIYYMMTDDKNIYDVKYYIKFDNNEYTYRSKSFYSSIKNFNDYPYINVVELSETEFLAEML